MPSPESLGPIQRWMQAVIRNPDGPDAALIEAVIEPSQRLSSRDRLQIYANAYFARLLEVMTTEFPATAAAVGADVFAEFVHGYLQRHPSTSYTLSQLGAKFPQHLAETRPPREQSDPDWIDCLIEIATLERLYSEVFDGPGTEELPPLDVSAITADEWPDCRLTCAPCVRLIRLQFPAHEFITAVRRGEQPPPPELQSTNLIITRRDYVVRRRAVADDEFRLLSRLSDGATVGEALSQWSAEFPVVTPPLAEWFERWTAAGYFMAVNT